MLLAFSVAHLHFQVARWDACVSGGLKRLLTSLVSYIIRIHIQLADSYEVKQLLRVYLVSSILPLLSWLEDGSENEYCKSIGLTG